MNIIFTDGWISAMDVGVGPIPSWRSILRYDIYHEDGIIMVEDNIVLLRLQCEGDQVSQINIVVIIEMPLAFFARDSSFSPNFHMITSRNYYKLKNYKANLGCMQLY